MTNTSNTTSAGAKYNKALKVVFIITLSYLFIEVIIGILSNSLALLSDAAHMLTDVGGQALALFAIWMSSKPRNNRKTFGYYRVEILSALINAVVLIVISGGILFEAWQRFKKPPAVQGVSMLIVALCGLIVNLIAMQILRKGSEESINIKGAFLEVVSDMLSSVGVIIAGIVVLTTGWLYIDPIVSALIGLFILPRTFRLLKESVDVLLEAVPRDIDYAAVEKRIIELPEVQSVHDMHIWTLTSGIISLSAHVIMKPESSFSEINEVLKRIRAFANSEFRIKHTTIEIHYYEENYQNNFI